MNRLLHLIIASILLTGSSVQRNSRLLVENKSFIPIDKSRPVKVFILAGQSNAVGYNHIRELHYQSENVKQMLNKQSTILFWPGSNAKPGSANIWTKLQIGLSEISINEPYKDGCFGPEIGLSLGIQKVLPDEKIAVIKYAEGGTGIARSVDYQDYIPALKDFDDKGRNWYPPTEGKAVGSLYKSLIENIQNALAALKSQGLNYEIDGFLWMQGEHEAGISKKMASDYGKLLTIFRESIRHDLNIKELPFIVGEINSHTWAFADIARNNQASACQKDPHSRLIKTTDLSRGSIGGAAHFDADGMLTLGERFANGMLLFLKGKDEPKPTVTIFKKNPDNCPDFVRILTENTGIKEQ
jgi:hypothetical protein